jgi:hypothetical protein
MSAISPVSIEDDDSAEYEEKSDTAVAEDQVFIPGTIPVLGLIEDNETVVKHNQQGRYRARGLETGKCF